jgi:hypothetical protein
LRENVTNELIIMIVTYVRYVSEVKAESLNYNLR